ncbi:MAG TPA: energy-coupling factor transporter transmembrane component T [Syntrophomonadaceae bacterium]|nr:energy-coupling factor transporter transmembrane component T [Syntrophomonadaceae bacterium]
MVFCITTLAIIYNTPGRLFLLLVGTCGMLILFHIDLKTVGGYLKPYFFLLLILFLAQCIFTPGGEVLLRVGSVNILGTRGLILGTGVVLRLLIVVAVAILLTTSNSRDFISGLVQWKVPYEIAFMVSITIRFLPIFRDEFVNVVTAVQLRGVELKQVPWAKKLDLFKRLLFPVIYGTILKAQQLSIAMEARGFRAYARRTYLRQLKLSFADYAVMLFFLTATLTLIGMQVYPLRFY